jgi:hypothetical protein
VLVDESGARASALAVAVAMKRRVSIAGLIDKDAEFKR